MGEVKPTSQDEELAGRIRKAMADLGIEHFFLTACTKFEQNLNEKLECGHENCHPIRADTAIIMHSTYPPNNDMGNLMRFTLVTATMEWIETQMKQNMINAVMSGLFGIKQPDGRKYT